MLTDRVNVSVTGIPKGQPRPKAFARGGHAGVYDPGTANEWKASIAEAFKPHHGLSLNQPLSVHIVLFIPRPKGHFTPKGALTKSAPIHHTAKPDLDNAAKAILDAMTDFQFWKDDSCCINLGIRKCWCTQAPGAHITITPVIDE